MSLTDKLKAHGIDPSRSLSSRGTVWAGPESNTPNGGVTFSLLSRFLVCRERFRLLVVEGLRPREKFNNILEFGNMWHACEEAFCKGPNSNHSWEEALTRYVDRLNQYFPFERDDIAHWAEKIANLFPTYIEYWNRHPDVLNRSPVLEEKVFNVPYMLPSGRTVRLRGKWDAVHLISEGPKKGRRGFQQEAVTLPGLWLQENKSKSSIDQAKISRQLSFDLQTMLYMIALTSDTGIGPLEEVKGFTGTGFANPVQGVMYNVVRRSAHKTSASMMKKVTEDLDDGRGNEWFSRWNVDIQTPDVETFRRTCFDPILECLCYWWDWINDRALPVSRPYAINMWSWRHPFGVYNVLDEGGSSDLDHYLATRSEVGLTRTSQLFPELV